MAAGVETLITGLIEIRKRPGDEPLRSGIIGALSTYLQGRNTRMRVRRLALILRSGSQGGDRDLSPGLESSPQFLLVRGRSKPMPTQTEVLGDGTIGREETLGLARRFEPLHAPFPW